MPTLTAFTTVADAKDALNIPQSNTANDTELQGYINAATPIIEDIVGPVAQRQIVGELHDGGSPVIKLNWLPIKTVDTVTESLGGTLYTLSQVAAPYLGSAYSYMVNPVMGTITRMVAGGASTPFRGGRNAIAVTYTVGYAQVIGDLAPNIVMAAKELVRHDYSATQQGGRPGFGSVDQTSMVTTPRGFAVPNYVVEMLKPTRRPPGIA